MHDLTIRMLPSKNKEVGELITNLQESFKDLRTMAVQKLQAYNADVLWSLPAGAKARAAPHRIARIYRSSRSFEDYVRELIRRKELSGNHLSDEMLMLAMLMDRAIAEAPPDWINYKTTEMAMRRLYGLEQAFSQVKTQGDWKAPRNAGAKWGSRVLFHVLDEIDVGSMDIDGIGIEPVDREVRDRLKDKHFW